MIKDKENWIEIVYEIVRQVPRGKVTTYGNIAALIGLKSGARMVGWAMNLSHKAKPKVPAHRVVNAKGVLSGKLHFETPTRMQELLEKEGIKIINDQIVNFEKHIWQIPKLDL